MSNTPSRIGLLYHPMVEESQQLARELARVVESCGREPWIESAWARDEIVAEADSCGLLVTLGGDGTILRVARAALASSLSGDGRRVTPLILSVDFGTLGFLTEVAPADAATGLLRVLDGEFWVEERAFLKATLERDGEVVDEREALNDVVLARGDGPHAIRLVLSVDGAEMARYTADAMIVASPTGSTAYAFGAGGPIVAPGMDGLVVVPVAPHFAIARSFVVPAQSRVMLHASVRRHTVVTIDGQIHIPYEQGDKLYVTGSAAVARFVRTGPQNYFYRTLQERLRRQR